MTIRARRGPAILACALVAAIIAGCGNGGSGGGKATTAATGAVTTAASPTTGGAAPAEPAGSVAAAAATGLAGPTVAALDRLAAEVGGHTMVPCSPTGLGDCVATEAEDLAAAATALQQALKLARTTVPAGPCATGLDHAIAWRTAQLARLDAMRRLSGAATSATRDQQLGTAIQAEFDAQSTELDWATTNASTAWQLACDPAAADGRLDQAGYDAVTASRAGIDKAAITACNGTWPKIGRCLVKQIERDVPILARYHDGLAAAAAALPPGRCQTALAFAARFRADQLERYRRVGTLSRKIRTEQDGAAVNAVIDRLSAATIANTANQLAQPAMLWQAACRPV
jgi:hypothetical protein